MIRKILFVDDDQILRAAIEQRLSSYPQSFGLVTAVDGFDAVKKLKEHPVSLVVLDLVMPRMDGMSLIDHISQNYPDLPVVIISGIGDQQLREVASNSSAYGYLNKPFQADDLLGMIQDVLGKEAEGGIMNDVSPSVFMQMVEMEGRTCTIRILDNLSEKGGILFFNQGELFDTRVGEISGIDAAHQVFSWDRTTIFINNECQVSENRVNTNLGSIIMKAAGMKDEAEERSDDYNEQESIASLSDDDDYGLQPGSGIDSGGDDLSEGGIPLEALREAIEKINGVTSIGEDSGSNTLIDRVSHLGERAGYGELLLVNVNQRKQSSRVIVPTTPPAVIKAAPGAVDSIKKIIQTPLGDGSY